MYDIVDVLEGMAGPKNWLAIMAMCAFMYAPFLFPLAQVVRLTLLARKRLHDEIAGERVLILTVCAAPYAVPKGHMPSGTGPFLLIPAFLGLVFLSWFVMLYPSNLSETPSRSNFRRLLALSWVWSLLPYVLCLLVDALVAPSDWSMFG